jgi:methyl-accepting chemotaxis protein
MKMTWSLRKKMLVGSCSVILLVLCSSIYNITSTFSLEKSSFWVDHTHKVLAKATDILAAAVDMETGMRGFLLAGKEEFLDPYHGGKKKFHKNLTELKSTVSDNPQQVGLLEEIEKTITDWQVNITEPIIEKRRQVGSTLTMDNIADIVGQAKGKIYFDTFRTQIKTFKDREQLLMASRQERTHELAIATNTSILVGGIVLILISIFSTFFVNKSILNPISQTGNMLQDIAKGDGDLTQRLGKDRDDEIGSLSEHFNEFCEKIRHTIEQISTNTRSLSQTSSDLKIVAEGSSTSSVKMADQTQQAGDSMSQLSAKLIQLNQGAKSVSSNVNSVASAIHEVDSSINEVSASCSEGSQKSMIAEQKAARTGQVMGELKDSAAKIGSVVDTINDIAGKTDLLALNATIEAASAGEAGSGFAVVANEVKELATQTERATKEIGDLIAEMQTKTDLAVDATDEISELINHLNDTMQSISSAITQQSSATNEITRTIEGTSSSATEMSENIDQVSTLSNQVADNVKSLGDASSDVKTSAASTLQQSQDLDGMSTELSSLVKQFKT